MVGAGRRGWEGGIDCYPALMMVVFYSHVQNKNRASAPLWRRYAVIGLILLPMAAEI